MLKYSLCIEPVFPEVDFYERIELAAGLGFDAVEFWDPAGKDLNSIALLAVRNKLEIATCCALDAWGKHMCAPAEVVIPNIRESVRVALDLGCTSLIVLSGPVEDNQVAQKARLIDNLKRCRRDRRPRRSHPQPGGAQQPGRPSRLLPGFSRAGIRGAAPGGQPICQAAV